jgi:ASC-1-like (ASCH) protein
MTIIKKKIWSEYFDAVATGKKKFELRLNDFEVSEGDILSLEECLPATLRLRGGRGIRKQNNILAEV